MIILTKLELTSSVAQSLALVALLTASLSAASIITWTCSGLASLLADACIQLCLGLTADEWKPCSDDASNHHHRHYHYNHHSFLFNQHVYCCARFINRVHTQHSRQLAQLDHVSQCFISSYTGYQSAGTCSSLYSTLSQKSSNNHWAVHQCRFVNIIN